MLRRFYHVNRVLNLPRVISRSKDFEVTNLKLNGLLNSTPSSVNDPEASSTKETNDETISKLNVPSSKQIFSNITKPSPPRNIVQISPRPDSFDQRKNPPDEVALVRQRKQQRQSLRELKAKENLPQPIFMEERKEIYHTRTPKRIKDMKFDQDVVEEELDDVASLFELRSSIRLHLSVMDNLNFLDALSAFHRILTELHDARDISSEEILDIPEFVIVVKGLVKYCRDFTHDEACEVASIMLDLHVPVDSLPMQVFFELLKTHLNLLSINQLVRLFKSMSIASSRAATMMEIGGGGDEEEVEAALKKFSAILMGTERLILMRFSEEQSWLTCEEIVDVVTYLRPGELTRELYRQALALLLAQCHRLTVGPILQYCRWLGSLVVDDADADDDDDDDDGATNPGRPLLIRGEEFERYHAALFPVFIKIVFEADNDVDDTDDVKIVMRAMVEFCPVEICLEHRRTFQSPAGRNEPEDSTLPFCHATYDLSHLLGFVFSTRIVSR